MALTAGTEREYVLKWHSFSSTIQAVFRRLLENSAFADVTLSVESQTLHCHRIVLSACSTYFENLLTNHPGDHPIIILLDIPHPVVVALVNFMYSGEIRLPQEQLQCFLKAAEMLRIKGLTETEGVPDKRVVDSSQPPPLIPATPGAVATPLATSTPSTSRPSTAWIAPVPATKRRSPEPAYEDSSPHDLSAKRRRPRHAQQQSHLQSQQMPMQQSLLQMKLEEPLKVEPVVEEQPLSLTIRHDTDNMEQATQMEEEEEEINVEETGEPELCVDEDATDAPGAEDHPAVDEACDGDLDEDEDAERAAEEAAGRRRLEEDIELVSGESTSDAPATAPGSPPQQQQAAATAALQQQQPPGSSQLLAQALTQPQRASPNQQTWQQQSQEQQTSGATGTATGSTSFQSASEAAASTLMNSCGGDVPWKDPRWTSLLPEEKVMEAMGNMLDVPTLAAKLMKNLFTEEERINSNTTGDHGKQIFDKEKMDLIKSIVFHVSKIGEEDQFGRDDLWVRCKMKIDKWNRDLRYARKKKDKDTSLPTMVKLEYASGRDDDWEREHRDELQSLVVGAQWAGERGYSGVQSPPPRPPSGASPSEWRPLVTANAASAGHG